MTKTALTLSFLLITSACGDFADGELSIAVYGEDFIEVGIPAGEMVDGWAVTFDRFDVDIGEVVAGELAAADYRVVDLSTDSGGAGTELASATVTGGAYDDVTYRIRSVELDGSATLDGETKTFSWVFDVPTRYSECEGTAVVDGAAARLELTIHGDHLFYDDLVSSVPNVAFDLVAAADADDDGEVTEAELAAVDITTEERYQVGNFDVSDLWSFIEHQVGTIGHIDGEGHCGRAVRE